MQLLQATQDFPFKLWQRVESAAGSLPQVVFDGGVKERLGEQVAFDCVVVAAGIGSRMKADRPKQYLDLCGHSLLEWTVCQLLQSPFISRVVLVLHPEDIWFKQTFLATNPVLSSRISVVAGGKERVDSVYCGLKVVQSEWCLVHDAARPFVHIADIEQLIVSAVHWAKQSMSTKQSSQESAKFQEKAMPQDKPMSQEETISQGEQALAPNLVHIQGAILAIPETDTLKRKQEESFMVGDCTYPVIAQTEDRSKIYRAQTPQMFKTQYLLDAISTLQERGKTITDEASVVDFVAKDSALLVEGSSFNFKITTPSDLLLAQALIKHMQ